jgi:nucleoside-diphosphate-sugar epimerase
VCNVAGGGEASMAEILDLAAELTGRTIELDRRPAQAGDVARTGGDITRARELLRWVPATSLRDGMLEQIAWHQAYAPIL